MPTVRSVSDITNILSSIIQNPILQNVRVQGEVSVDDDDPRGVFWLRHEKDKIRCFIPGRDADQFGSLLKAGNTVVVNGTIKLFPAISEYQIYVADVLPIAKAPEMNQQLTVSEMTAGLSSLIQDASPLQNIQVSGDISNFFSDANKGFWFLSDIGIVGSQKIHCVSFQPDRIAVGNGDQIQAEGNIQIWGAYSRYEINVTLIEPYDSTEQCQCAGCDQCTGANQCNRPREIANFESCAKCLPNSPDELYTLCPECYSVNPDRETEVAAAVDAYFSELGVKGFSSSTDSTECRIQFGTRNGIADVVLRDENGSFAAVAECKGAGYTGHGIEQLKSYLAATDTRFGIFANRADKNHWKFYENRQRNQIVEIDPSEFEAGVIEKIAARERLKDEIEHLNGKVLRLENQISELDTTVDRVTQTKFNLTERTSELKQQIEVLEKYKFELHEEIRQKLDNLLEGKIQRLEKYLLDLKIELQERGIINWFKNLFSKENV